MLLVYCGGLYLYALTGIPYGAKQYKTDT